MQRSAMAVLLRALKDDPLNAKVKADIADLRARVRPLLISLTSNRRFTFLRQLKFFNNGVTCCSEEHIFCTIAKVLQKLQHNLIMRILCSIVRSRRNVLGENSIFTATL